MEPATVISLALSVILLTCRLLTVGANPSVTASTIATTVDDSSGNYDNHLSNNITIADNDNSTSITNGTTSEGNWTSGESPPLQRCQYKYGEESLINLFVSGDDQVLPLETKNFILTEGQSRCYLTRDDFESKLNVSSQSEAIAFFAILCPHFVTDVVLLDDLGNQPDVSGTTPAASEDLETWSTSGSSVMEDTTGTSGDFSATVTTTATMLEVSSSSSSKRRLSERYYSNYISYFQSRNCRMDLRVVEAVAKMTDLRVLYSIGHRAWNLTQLQEDPQLCNSFQKVKAFGMLSDWTLADQIHYLEICKGKLDNVVEVIFYNSSFKTFPDFLQRVLPSIRALELNKNQLTVPVSFPWSEGFAILPRNLSRTSQFNTLYSFLNSFDMPNNQFRRVLLYNNNNITNLTHFQFTSEFQHISIMNNGLRQIAENTFDLVRGVQFVSLAENLLETIPARLFSKLKDLQKIDLQGNKLKRLPTDIFRNLRKLKHLNLERNQLEVLQDGLFTRLEELRELKLKKNSIVQVAPGAFSMMVDKLRLVELQYNPLKTFPAVLLKLRSLVTTNLEYTDIEVLDFVRISRHTSTSQLSHSLGNPTTGDFVDQKTKSTTKREVSLRFSKLRSIVLYNTTRDTLPVFLLVAKHFAILVEGSRLACDCNILNVTHQLQNWTSDKTLSGDEPILRGWTCEWPSELVGTPVSGLKDEQTYCPLKTSLDTGPTARSSCPEGCTCYVRTKIRTVIVDCQDEGLTALPSHVPFNTRELWLQNNTIKTVDNLPYLRHLHSLKLTANNVQELPMDVLRNMPDLRTLHVDDNWLTGLVPDFARLTQLADVRLAGNPFRCDCHTLWMQDWLLRHQTEVTDGSTIKCSTDDADGREFFRVPPEEFTCKVSASLEQVALPIAVPVALAFLLLTAGVATFLFRRRLKVWLYIHTGAHPFDKDPPDDRALYDVSVCCDVTARAWVLRNVIEALEDDDGGRRQRYRVFFYHRDAFVGFTTSENVRHSVKCSRRLVVVLGKAWERNELLVSAAREGLTKCRKETVQFLTVVLHNLSAKDIADNDLQMYVKKGRHVSTEDKHFLSKLLYQMPHVTHVRTRGEKKEGKRRRRGRQEEKLPEPVAMYDILAAADNEQNDMMEKRNSDLPRQLSAVELQRNLRNSRQNVDLNPNPDNDRAGNIIRRQNSEQSSVVSQELEDIHLDITNNEDADDDVVNERHQQQHDNPAFHHQLSVDSGASLQHDRIKSVFVWYADDDLLFTLKSVVNPLEKRGHACVLRDRDFPLGAPIQENIVHAVTTCTRSIFVLSDLTPRNEWFSFVFHVTFDRQLQCPDHRVALVTREGLDASKYLQEIQQVMSTSALLEEGDPWFWKRLKQFINFDGQTIS